MYVAAGCLRESNEENIHISKRWDFDKLLNETVLFINHGGQNSVIQGLQYEVPQLIISGNVFERQYNAESISNKGAAVILSNKDFNWKTIFAKRMT